MVGRKDIKLNRNMFLKQAETICNMKNLLTLAVLAVVVIISGCTQGINQTPTQSTTTLAQPSTVIEKFVGGDDFKVIGYPGTWKTKLTKEAILFIGPQESGVVVMF